MQTPHFVLSPEDSLRIMEAQTDPQTGGIGPETDPNRTQTPRFRPQIDDSGVSAQTPGSATVSADAHRSELAEDRPPRHDRFAFRCTPAYHSWLVGLSDWMGHIGVTITVEQALRRLAESSGYPALPPRRYQPSPRLRDRSSRWSASGR